METQQPSRRLELGSRLLLAFFLFQVPLGYSVVVGYRSAIWAVHRRGMARALWGTDTIPEAAWPVVDQLGAMLGATIVAWGLAMAWVVWIPLRHREPWAWWCIMVTLWSWGAVDTAVSAVHGVWVNVAFNAVPLVFVTAVLLALRREVLGERTS